MKEHYNLSDDAYAALLKDGVTLLDMMKAVKIFDPNDSKEPLGLVNLYYYIDSKGDFNAPPKKLKHKLLAKALFESLGLTAKEKLAVFQYIEDASNNFIDEED